MTDYTYYRAPDGATFRIHLEQDTDAESPRGDSNVTIMHTFGTDYFSPDGERCQDRRHRQVHPLDGIPSEYVEDRFIDMRRASRYVHLFSPDILAIAGLAHCHDGTLSFNDERGRSTEWYEEGYIAITRESWAECMGDTEPTPELIEQIMRQECETYNRWASGEYVGFVVEKREEWIHAADQLPVMHTWEQTDSVWGFDDEKYAMDEAKGMLPEGSEEIDENELEDEK